MNSPYELSDDMPVYVISVAASLSGMHPQTLRGYERVGLVTPRRTTGGGRRYSMRDILDAPRRSSGSPRTRRSTSTASSASSTWSGSSSRPG